MSETPRRYEMTNVESCTCDFNCKTTSQINIFISCSAGHALTVASNDLFHVSEHVTVTHSGLLASTAKTVFQAAKFLLLDKRPFLYVVCICILIMPAQRTIVFAALEKQIAYISCFSSLLRRTRKHMRRASTLVYGACSPSKGLFWLHVCKTTGQRKTLRVFSFATIPCRHVICAVSNLISTLVSFQDGQRPFGNITCHPIIASSGFVCQILT